MSDQKVRESKWRRRLVVLVAVALGFAAGLLWPRAYEMALLWRVLRYGDAVYTDPEVSARQRAAWERLIQHAPREKYRWFLASDLVTSAVDFAKKGEVTTARAMCERAIQLNAHDHMIYLTMARIALIAGEWEEAALCYRIARYWVSDSALGPYSRMSADVDEWTTTCLDRARKRIKDNIEVAFANYQMYRRLQEQDGTEGEVRWRDLLPTDQLAAFVDELEFELTDEDHKRLLQLIGEHRGSIE